MTDAGISKRKQAHAVGAAIWVSNLCKSFQHKQVLNGLSLEVNKGELFGLIGPDGAGKTTTMQIIAGVMRFDSGEIHVLDQSPVQAKKRIAYVTQQFSLFPDLSVAENLEYIAGLHDVPDDEFQQRQKSYLQHMGLHEFSDRLASRLSGGMKQKLALCAALISKPDLILLDEPTAGIDPVSRLEFWDLIAGIRAAGITIIVATPYWDEAERCDRIALMREGQIESCGEPERLKSDLKLARFEIQTSDDKQAEQLFRVAVIQEKQNFIVDSYSLGDRIDLLVRESAFAESRIKAMLAEHQIGLNHISRERPTIENVFFLHMEQSGQNSEFQNAPEMVSSRESADSTRSGLVNSGGSAIKAEHLSKKFRDFVAVKDFSIDIKYGDIYGLLGANGAGKTTAIRMIAGLLVPSGGNVKLGGETSQSKLPSFRKKIGYMSQKNTLYSDLTVLENLQFYSSIYEIPLKLRSKTIDWAVHACGLEQHIESLVSSLPAGWRQRVAFAAAIMHQPEILFLDEPTSGVDPMSRRELWSVIRHLAEKGDAILVTTHFLDEAEYCNRLGLMVAGEIVIEGSPRDLKKTENTRNLEEAFVSMVRKQTKRTAVNEKDMEASH